MGLPLWRSRDDVSCGRDVPVPVPARDEFRLRAEGFDRGRLTRYGLYWAEETKLDLVLRRSSQSVGVSFERTGREVESACRAFVSWPGR